MNSGNANGFQQIHNDIFIGFDDGAILFSAPDQTGAVGINIKSTFRCAAGKTCRIIDHFNNHIAPGLKFS